MELLKVPQEVARNYKAELYRRVREKNPELNGYDRAIEMEKMATVAILKKIDIDAVTKAINKKREERLSMTANSASTSSSVEVKPKSNTRKTKKV